MNNRSAMIDINGLQIPVIILDCAIIGSGCAGFNAADWLYDLGRRNIAIITEGVNMGTSRNTGSDKQTYYKMSLASDGEDSVSQLAETLYRGGGVHGDIALTEAACSVKSFIKLANLGVPFPTNDYGEYVGYKTDHDPRQRATSAGPLTSKYMTECLERSAKEKGIEILDGMTAIQLIVIDNHIEGVICLDNSKINLLGSLHYQPRSIDEKPSQLDSDCYGLCIVRAKNVIMATGGPAGCYHDSVFPHSQTGMTGMALEAGAQAINLQEWQYGLASTKFRWNVSGTYQQVLPKYISVDKNGVEHEFLPDYYDSPLDALNMVFLKGYQWPFDINKVKGSSMIDILVHREINELGRKVFMDFRTDPTGLEAGFEGLGEEAYHYLNNSDALISTPINRLAKMNPLAIDLYKNNGIDLYNEPLEIAVCVQHHNGGIAVDHHWQSSIKGLYAAGEVAGTFGAYRPGGSALNSSQVGSMRAAEHIAYNTKPDESLTAEFKAQVEDYVVSLFDHFKELLSKKSEAANLLGRRKNLTKQMSARAGHIRDIDKMTQLQADVLTQLENFFSEAKLTTPTELPMLLKNRDILITQAAILSAMIKAADKFGSRGSALVLQQDINEDSEKVGAIHYRKPEELSDNLVVVTENTPDGFCSSFVKARKIPKPDSWFENVWREYRQRTRIE